MTAAASQTAGRDRGNADGTAEFARHSGIIRRSGNTWESRPALSAPYSPAVNRRAHRRQRSGSQPLSGADRPSLDRGRPTRAPVAFLGALQMGQVDAGSGGADRAGNPFARTQATASNCLERKTPARKTARELTRVPYARVRGQWPSLPQEERSATRPPKLSIDDRLICSKEDGPHFPRWNFIAHHRRQNRIDFLFFQKPQILRRK